MGEGRWYADAVRVSRIVSVGVVVGALLAAASTGAALATLKTSQADALALRAAQFQGNAWAPYRPDSRLSVTGARLVREGRNLVWVVDVHSTVAIFPCRLPLPGGPTPSCIPPPTGLSHNAVITILNGSNILLHLRAPA